MVGADPLAPENLVVSTLHEFLQSQGTVLTKFPRGATNLTAHFWIFQDPRVLNTGALPECSQLQLGSQGLWTASILTDEWSTVRSQSTVVSTKVNRNELFWVLAK